MPIVGYDFLRFDIRWSPSGHQNEGTPGERGVKEAYKRTVDAAQPTDHRYIVWDTALKGFGLRVEASGTKTFILRYRPRGEAASQKRFMTIGRLGALTPEEARLRARSILGDVANGRDPARDRVALKEAPSIAKLYDEFEALHVRPKLKPSTVRSYQSLYDVYVAPWPAAGLVDTRLG